MTAFSLVMTYAKCLPFRPKNTITQYTSGNIFLCEYSLKKQVLAYSHHTPVISTCLLSLTPVMTADDPCDTNNKVKSSRKKDLMMKSCLCAPVSSRVKSKDSEAVGPSCMCIRDRQQRQVAFKLMCLGLAEVYKPSPPFRNSVTHSHQNHLTRATKPKNETKVKVDTTLPIPFIFLKMLFCFYDELF